ncbi:putative uncharacterized protein DDB_G0290521 isoform X2 [Periplaneta americana]
MKGKARTSDDIESTSHVSGSRFMTWTPKLLRKTGFRRSSPPSRPSQEPLSPFSGRFSFRTSSSRTSLPPSSRTSLPPSSRTSLPPSSRSSLPPSGPRPTLPSSNSRPSTSPPSRPTSPPARPAPPNLRTSVSPSRPVPPATSPSTDIVHTQQSSPAPASRRALFPASATIQAVGDQATEEESKYIQQGAKPKKKRRAPAPPVPSPAKAAGDNRQVNSNESDASMSSSVTSSSAEEPTSHEQSVAATPDLEAITQEPEQPASDEPKTHHDTTPEEPENTSPEHETTEHDGLEKESHSKDDIPEHALQNGSPENHPEDNVIQSQDQLEEKGNDESPELEQCRINGTVENGDQIDDADHAKKDNKTDEGSENEAHHENKSSAIENDIKSQYSPENEIQNRDNKLQQSYVNGKDENMNSENGLDDGFKNITNSDQLEEKPVKMQNGGAKRIELQIVEDYELEAENKKTIPNIVPAPKPRTILPFTAKN